MELSVYEHKSMSKRRREVKLGIMQTSNGLDKNVAPCRAISHRGYIVPWAVLCMDNKTLYKFSKKKYDTVYQYPS